MEARIASPAASSTSPSARCSPRSKCSTKAARAKPPNSANGSANTAKSAGERPARSSNNSSANASHKPQPLRQPVAPSQADHQAGQPRHQHQRLQPQKIDRPRPTPVIARLGEAIPSPAKPSQPRRRQFRPQPPARPAGRRSPLRPAAGSRQTPARLYPIRLQPGGDPLPAAAPWLPAAPLPTGSNSQSALTSSRPANATASQISPACCRPCAASRPGPRASAMPASRARLSPVALRLQKTSVGGDGQQQSRHQRAQPAQLGAQAIGKQHHDSAGQSRHQRAPALAGLSEQEDQPVQVQQQRADPGRRQRAALGHQIQRSHSLDGLDRGHGRHVQAGQAQDQRQRGDGASRPVAPA